MNQEGAGSAAPGPPTPADPPSGHHTTSGRRQADHRAFSYRGASEYAEVVGAFVREGLDRTERVVVWTPTQQRRWIRDALGAHRSPVQMTDAGELFRPQGKMIATVLGRLDGAVKVRVVAERPRGRASRREMDDYLRIEAAANVFFSNHSTDISVLCPYDTSALDPEILAASSRTHPFLVAAGSLVESQSFEDPRRFITTTSAVVHAPRHARSVGCERAYDLAAARSFVRAEAVAAGVSGDRSTNLVVAVHEVLTNALVHGKPPRRLFVYAEEDALVCHVNDGGPGLADPLDVYRPHLPGSSRGLGLVYARQNVDWLEAATDATGTHVRLGITRPSHDA